MESFAIGLCGRVARALRPSTFIPAIAVVLLSVSLAPPAVADDPLTAVFSGGSFHISGVSRGGDVVVFGISREQVDFGHGHTVVQRRVISDAPASGVVSFAPHRTPAPASLWVFVDQTSGRYVLTTPSGASGVLPLSADVVDQSILNDGGDAVVVRLSVAEVLLVSPGDGAWTDTIFDAGADDHPTLPDGLAQWKAEKMKAFKGGKKKLKLKKDDLLVVIEPRTLRVATVRVK